MLICLLFNMLVLLFSTQVYLTVISYKGSFSCPIAWGGGGNGKERVEGEREGKGR